MRSRRRFMPDRPVYTIGIAQPRIPWAGNDKGTYAQTLYRPEEKTIYAHKVSQQTQLMPAVMEHADQSEAGHTLPEDVIIGDSVGAMHDGVGNLFQVNVLNPSRREAAKIWNDLEAGVPVGLSLWHDVVRDLTTNTVVDIRPRHIGFTYEPAWGRVSYEDGSPEYDKGSYIRHWTQDPHELKRFIEDDYARQPAMFVPPALTRRLQDLVEHAPPPSPPPSSPQQPASEDSEPPLAQSLLTQEAIMATAGPTPPQQPAVEKWHSSDWVRSWFERMSTGREDTQPAAAAPAATPPPPLGTTPAKKDDEPSQSFVQPIPTTLDDIRARAVKINAERNYETRLSQVVSAMEDTRRMLVTLPTDKISAASAILVELGKEYEALVAPVNAELSVQEDVGTMEPDAVMFMKEAMNNRNTKDGRYITQFTLAMAKSAQSQRAAEKALSEQFTKKADEATTLKRERDEFQEEAQKSKKQCIDLLERLKAVGPKEVASTSESKPAPTTAPNTVLQPLQAAAPRMKIGSAGQAGTPDEIRRIFKQNAERERMGLPRWSTQAKMPEMMPTPAFMRSVQDVKQDIDWGSRVTVSDEEKIAIEQRIMASIGQGRRQY